MYIYQVKQSFKKNVFEMFLFFKKITLGHYNYYLFFKVVRYLLVSNHFGH